MTTSSAALPVFMVSVLAVACGGSGGGESSAPAAEAERPASEPETATADACAALTKSDIEQAVGNTVLPGEPESGSETCDWDTENPDDVSVLLILRPKGGIREETLCADLRQSNEGERVSGLGEVAVWKFSAMGTMFNSGDLEACGPRGFVSISLNGKTDEAKLKEAAVTLVRKVMGG